MNNIYNYSKEVVKTSPIRRNTEFEEVIPIRRVWRYPLYNGANSVYDYDIAIIELGKRFDSSTR